MKPIRRWFACCLSAATLFGLGCGHSNRQLMTQLVELKRELRSIRNDVDKRSDKLEDLSNRILLLQDAVDSNRTVLYRQQQVPVLPVIKLEPPTKKSRVKSESDKLLAELENLPEPKTVVTVLPKTEPTPPRKGKVTTEPSVNDFNTMKFDVLSSDGDLKRKLETSIKKGEKKRMRKTKRVERRPRLKLVRLKAPKKAPRVVKPLRVVKLETTPRKQSLLDALKLYNAAMVEYRAKNIAAAMEKFKRFAVLHPAHPYADNAYYWIGECHYDRGHWIQALAAFRTVLKRYPLGNKVPAAMLKIALVLKRQGKAALAKNQLFRLMEVYPMSDAAKVAVTKMQEFSL